jgi:hypothetical protein
MYPQYNNNKKDYKKLKMIKTQKSLVPLLTSLFLQFLAWEGKKNFNTYILNMWMKDVYFRELNAWCLCQMTREYPLLLILICHYYKLILKSLNFPNESRMKIWLYFNFIYFKL